MQKHLTIVAMLHIAFGILLFCIGLGVFFVVSGAGLLSREPEAMFITSLVGSAIGLFFTLISVPGIIAGIGVQRRLGWGRLLMMIIAFIELIIVPFGTIIGIYTLWVLLKDESVALFRD